MSFGAALHAELLKARRSAVPRMVALGFSLVPLVGALFMLILEDPERARAWGIIGSKAQMTAGVADWPSYLGLLAQATAVGGLLVFSFLVSWMFGREFADRTAKELLATRTSRAAIVGAKAATAALLIALLILLVITLGLSLGYALELGSGTNELIAAGTARIALVGLLTMWLTSLFALLATVGRGYLVPLGVALLTMFCAQIAAALGWGPWFPFSVPALVAGAGGGTAGAVTTSGYVLVAAAGLLGLAATLAVWMRADQAR